MTRFIQQHESPKPTKEVKPTPKAGTKNYDYSKLADAKKIISPNGGYR